MLKNYFRRENHSSSSKTQSESTESVACDSKVTQPWQRVEQRGWGKAQFTLKLSVYVKLWYSGHSGEERGLISRTAAGNRAYRLRRLPGLQFLISFPDAEIVVHLAPCWKLFVHRLHKMLAVLSKSMRSLFMQEFSPYICMLVRFNMTKLESFTTMFLEGQPGQYHGTLAHVAQL